MFDLRRIGFVFFLLVPIPIVLAHPAIAQDTNLFENSIRPVLVARCIKCHGPSKSESGLRLDRLPSMLAGGDSGPALVPGDVSKSLLASVLSHKHDIKMPPDKPLNEIEIQAFHRWIDEGAPWPENIKLTNGPELRSGPPTDAERGFWAFQPLRDCEPPDVDGLPNINNEIDRFVQAKLQEQKLVSNQPTDKRTLIRRVTFDLTGLPPTPEAIEEFVNDSKPDAWNRLLERLLDSKAYGERWGRHWLDVVRYSDTAGETADYPVPDAWRYRNYVIDSFNRDKPYDQFLREQIAGDILARRNVNSESYSEQVIATGFIAIARRFGFDSENYHHLTIQDTIDTVGQATLGLTIGCARCHDHKFDPISTEDYYALYGIFESTLYPLAGSEQKQRTRSLVPIRHEMTQPAVAAQLVKSIAAKEESLRKAGKAIPRAAWKSLMELDGDFEIQSAASGGSRGVLVAPWSYDGPISVTNTSQSPFVDAFPKGKVGVSFPAGQAVAGIWQALNHRSVNLSQQPLTLSVDFRVPVSTNGSTKATLDIADDLVSSAKSLASSLHDGLSLDLCQPNKQTVASVLIGNSDLKLQVGDEVIELLPIQQGVWYNLELTFSPVTKNALGVLRAHGAGVSSFVRSVTRFPDVQLTSLRLQTSCIQKTDLPLFEVDNLSIIPGNRTKDPPSEDMQKLAGLGDMESLQAELKSLAGVDGDLELQTDGQPPTKPWNAGPNSVVKIATRSQSPFRNYFEAGQQGVFMPNRAEYDGFGLQLEKAYAKGTDQLFVSFDFRCASQEAGGTGSWRYYLGHGPGKSAAVELFFNGSQFFRRSAENKDFIAEIKIGTWYQVQLDLDLKAKSYSGKLLSLDSEVKFSGVFASGWDGTIDHTFIDSYGHIGGIRPALDADNFSFGNQPSPISSSIDSATHKTTRQSAEARHKRIRDLRAQIATIQVIADEIEKQLLETPNGMCYAVTEGTPRDVAIHVRGEPSQPGKTVARRMPQLFASDESSAESPQSELDGSGRLELAHWITRDAKNLTARVFVNRVWQHHFGRGLVRTENDFGTRGELPTHAELLDWLACRFIESDWSIKQLHRLILRSATYQQSSAPNEQNSQMDPENRWLWRFSPRRLSAEEIRDAMLQISGKLDPSMGESHPFPAPHTWGFTQHSPFYAVYESNRRSIYLMQQRIKRHPYLSLFDGADPNVSTARREMTIVPTQALYLMNNPFVHEVAMKIAEPSQDSSDPSLAIHSLFQRCLGRSASQAEVVRSLNFLDEYALAQTQVEPSEDQRRRKSWAALARTLVTRNEFLFVE